jgi:secondary thiamine-phosphate synthase enzyme
MVPTHVRMAVLRKGEVRVSMVFGDELSVRTKGFSDMKNITAEVQDVVGRSKIRDGIVSIFVIGSTASVSTVEFEPALVEDMKDQLEKMAPSSMHSRHSQTWGDDNGFSHIRATLMGPGIVAPVVGGKILLGTWQQIVLIDHDNRPRDRRLYVQAIGE